MSKKSKYNYSKAEADLHDVGALHPDEIYGYKSEKGFNSYMKEHGLDPKKYTNSSSNKNSSNSGSSGCYLTTACVKSKGLPDDCVELQTLRSFRDSYLASRPNGQAEVEHYYRTAPGIVATIDQQANHREIWEQIYTELISPCVRMIDAQENENAYQLYKAYSTELFEKYRN